MRERPLVSHCRPEHSECLRGRTRSKMEEATKKSAVSDLIIVAITSPRVETHAKGLTSAALASKTTSFAVAGETFLLLWLQILFYDLEFLYLLNCLTALFCSPFDLVRFYIFMSCISIFLLLHPWAWSKFECFIFFIVNVFGMIHFLLWINDFYLLFKLPLSCLLHSVSKEKRRCVVLICGSLLKPNNS